MNVVQKFLTTIAVYISLPLRNYYSKELISLCVDMYVILLKCYTTKSNGNQMVKNKLVQIQYASVKPSMRSKPGKAIDFSQYMWIDLLLCHSVMT